MCSIGSFVLSENKYQQTLQILLYHEYKLTKCKLLVYIYFYIHINKIIIWQEIILQYCRKNIKNSHHLSVTHFATQSLFIVYFTFTCECQTQTNPAELPNDALGSEIYIERRLL